MNKSLFLKILVWSCCITFSAVLFISVALKIFIHYADNDFNRGYDYGYDQGFYEGKSEKCVRDWKTKTIEDTLHESKKENRIRNESFYKGYREGKKNCYRKKFKSD